MTQFIEHNHQNSNWREQIRSKTNVHFNWSAELLASEEVFSRHYDVIKMYFGSVGCVYAHFVFRRTTITTTHSRQLTSLDQHKSTVFAQHAASNSSEQSWHPTTEYSILVPKWPIKIDKKDVNNGMLADEQLPAFVPGNWGLVMLHQQYKFTSLV